MISHDREAAEFDKMHSGEDGYVVVDGTMLFSDGAGRSLKSWQDLGFEFRDPPTDKKELARRQKQFWTIRLVELTAAFESLKNRCENAAGSSAGHFKELKKQLEQLQSQVRSARSKLAHVTVLERGFSNSDIERAHLAWQLVSKAFKEEATTKAKFETALLGKSSPGQLERLKMAYDKAKKLSLTRIDLWNHFIPREARDIVTGELDAEDRRQREQELKIIEI